MQCWNLEFVSCQKSVASNWASLWDPCLQSPPQESLRFSTSSRTWTSHVNTSMMERELRFSLSFPHWCFFCDWGLLSGLILLWGVGLDITRSKPYLTWLYSHSIFLSELVWWQWIHVLEWLQIHYMEDGTIQIYSRNAEHNTGKFPDIVAAMPRWVMDPLVVTFNWMNGSQFLPSCIFYEP